MSDTTLIIDEVPVGASGSAVSWAAIFAGVFTALGLTLILLSLGAGLGLAAASPWAAPSGGAITALGAVWMVVTQWASASVGGYVAGRTRVRWAGLHSHEAFFRDTAHGLVVWAVATVLVAGLTAAATIGAVDRAADVAAKAAVPAYAYDADSLYRTAAADPAATAAPRQEAQRLLMAATAGGTLSPDDRAYLVGSVAARTGLDAAEAARRVDVVAAREAKVVTDAKQAADDARKAAARVALLTALSLLIGAFVGCVSAALGGKVRDAHP